MRLVASLILLAISSSCAHGPKVAYCVLSSADAGAACADHKGKEFFKTQPELENYACLSPEDLTRILESCRKNSVHVTFCVVANEIGGLVCSDADGLESTMTWVEAENYACLSPVHTGRLIKYCKIPPKKTDFILNSYGL